MDENEAEPGSMRRWDPEQALNSLAQERDIMAEDFEDQAKRIFRENLPMAAMSIVHMAQYDPNSRVRLSAAQYVAERVMGRTSELGDAGIAGDVFERFLAKCVKESEGAE